jgi:hypothetical protein
MHRIQCKYNYNYNKSESEVTLRTFQILTLMQCKLFQGNFGPHPPDKSLDGALNQATLWRTMGRF